MALKAFCKCTNDSFAAQYLRSPTTNDLRMVEDRFASAGFPGCIGVCGIAQGGTWDNCPKALSGLLSGKDKVQKLKMEVICDLDLYIWHIFCGLSGTMNDIDVMDVSPFFCRLTCRKVFTVRRQLQHRHRAVRLVLSSCRRHVPEVEDICKAAFCTERIRTTPLHGSTFCCA